MAVVFAKTKKGQDAIEHRSGGLTPRVRRLLIFIDGKRSVDDLRALHVADDLTHTLGSLEEEGFIELHGTQDSSGKVNAIPPGQPLPSITAFRPLPDPDPLNLAKARNFMNNTVNVFAGTVGTSTLIEHIQNAATHEELRALFDDWYYTIVSSRDGKREAETLRTKLLQVI